MVFISNTFFYSKFLKNLKMNMLNANTAIKKRSHAELTVPQKQEIIDYKKKFPKLTQKELIEKFSVEYKTIIPKSTMSDILPEYEKNPNMKKNYNN